MRMRIGFKVKVLWKTIAVTPIAVTIKPEHVGIMQGYLLQYHGKEAMGVKTFVTFN